MKITLEVVRQTLRDVLGFDSFVASFITEVHEDPSHPTAGITKEGRLSYSPSFVAEYVSCKEDLFSLIFHELLHPMFGHFIHGSGEIENIAADAIINGVIGVVYSDASRGGSLFRRFYPPNGITGLIRAGSKMGNSRYSKVYDRLYPNGYYSASPLSTGELIQSLKILTPHVDLSGIVLLGSHGQAGDGSKDGGTGIEGLPKETLARIAEEIKRSAADRAGRMAGRSEHLVSWLMEALRTHLSIRKALLQKFLTKRKIDKFKELFQDRRVSVSPIPICPSKRDLVMLAAGANPCYFHNRATRAQKRDRGLAIYLDVSGSVNEHLPKILGILRNLRKEIKTIFQFSNKIVETSFESLLKGNIQTTYGTDFDCIAQSILERNFDKAIVITDGYASMNEELKAQLKAHGLKALTILFGGMTRCEDFEMFGESVQLEDICE